tara:strand:- start:12414 stop:12782 length:369 start_codon:yes stop_codon:yes gene_type:complete
MSKIMSKKVSLIKEFYMNLGGFHIDYPNCESWTDEEWIAQADADDLDIMSQDNGSDSLTTINLEDDGSKSSDAYDEERLQEQNAELDSKVEWYNYFVDYVYKVNKNLYNDACEYADKEQSDD